MRETEQGIRSNAWTDETRDIVRGKVAHAEKSKACPSRINSRAVVLNRATGCTFRDDYHRWRILLS